MTKSSEVKQLKEISNNFNEIEFLFPMTYSNKSMISSNCIYYGPIRYYRRRRKAPTLLTGRRSKFEKLNGEENIQRELRLQKNRLLSKQLREKRENIEKELLKQMKQLEHEQTHLQNQIQYLKLYKNQLLEQLTDLKEDPLINLIKDKNISLFFEIYDD